MTNRLVSVKESLNNKALGFFPKLFRYIPKQTTPFNMKITDI